MEPDTKTKAYYRVFYSDLRQGKDPVYDPPIYTYRDKPNMVHVRCSSCMIKQAVPKLDSPIYCHFCYSKLSAVQIRNAQVRTEG